MRTFTLQLDQEIIELLLLESSKLEIAPGDYASAVLSGSLLGSKITSRMVMSPVDSLSFSLSPSLPVRVAETLKKEESGDQAETIEEAPAPEEDDMLLFSPAVFEQILEKSAYENTLESVLSNKSQDLLKSLALRGPFRKLSPIPDSSAFEVLEKKFPNFLEVIEKIQNTARIARLTGKKTQKIRPLLLSGPPGIGKTAFLKTLAAILGVPITFMDCSVMTAGSALTGLSFTWKGGTVGPVMRQVCLGQRGNPLFVLDEVDKTGKMREYSNVYDVLHGILEPVTAASLVDEGLGQDFPFDASFVTWVGTCNNISEIPASLLSRFLVFEIRVPSSQEMIDAVIPSIMTGILEERSLEKHMAPLPEEVLRRLARLTPREVMKTLESAVEHSVRRRLECAPESLEPIVLTNEDIVATAKSKEWSSMGFTAGGGF